ncbi:hypothetical protein NEIRO02_2132 [Nematocida sp. AWRm79]|nr:hypothetical protein NEIRO02_2132 [Nematocida sp. AWRm79]
MCDRPITSEKFSLTDCLSCAGCVSITEDTEDYKDTIELIKKGGVNIIITPQVKMSLYTVYNKTNRRTFREFEYSLIKVLSNNNNKVIDSSIGTKLLLNQEIDLLKSKNTVISTICPGTVLYVYNTLDGIDVNLSNNLSPVELSAKYINTYNNNVNISIVMCKDKRVEAKNNSCIKYCITAKEIYSYFLNTTELFQQNTPLDSNPNENPENFKYSEFEYKYSISRILNGSTSGGIFEGVTEYLSSQSGHNTQIIKKNPKHIELLPGEKKTLQLFGSSRIISFITKIKKERALLSEYAYIEMNMCLGGCLFGPSQSAIPDSQLYTELIQDKFSQESIEINPLETKPIRRFFKYKKPKDKKNYLVEW